MVKKVTKTFRKSLQVNSTVLPETSKVGMFEKLTPVLLVVTIALAFGVGVLWQKVASLEKGGSIINNANNAVPPAGGGAGSAPVTNVLADLPALVKDVGVDVNKFQSCLDSGKYKNRVESDYQDGIKAGVTGTPASFIVNKKGDVWFVPGAFPFESLKATVDIALGKASESTLPSQITKLTADKASAFTKLKDNDHVNGDRNAKVLLVEYSDFQCPFCQRFHPTTKQVLDQYGKDVALVYRHYPLDQIHPFARPTAEASECVAEIGGNDAFWKFTDTVFGI